MEVHENRSFGRWLSLFPPRNLPKLWIPELSWRTSVPGNYGLDPRGANLQLPVTTSSPDESRDSRSLGRPNYPGELRSRGTLVWAREARICNYP
eukprot:9058094-Pyramimonas_sp.AAC.1